MPLHHYIVVRRDLPFGVLAASIAHAAGESFYLFPGSSVKEHTDSSREVAGSSPALGSTFNPSETIAIILGARNEARLSSLMTMLLKAGVRYVPVVETEGPYAQQLLAVGLVPGEKHRLMPFINHFHMLPESLYAERTEAEFQDLDRTARDLLDNARAQVKALDARCDALEAELAAVPKAGWRDLPGD